MIKLSITVGFGIAPNQPENRFADYTAGGESHPAPNTVLLCFYYIPANRNCQRNYFVYLSIKFLTAGQYISG